MNIFILDLNPKLCAEYHINKHISKMVVESAQLLCTTLRYFGIDYGYKSTHVNHPCAKWTRESISNFEWLHSLGIELAKEYTIRYGKIHKTEKVIKNIDLADVYFWHYNNTNRQDSLTPFAQAMPEQYKNKDPVIAYRNYYLNEKAAIAKWPENKTPYWWIK